MNHKNTTLLTFYSLFMCLRINAEIFSSVYKLEKLLETQSSLIKTFDNFLKIKKSNNRIVKSYLEVLKKEQQDAINDTSLYLGKPMNSFRLIKRLTIDLDFVENVIKKITEFTRFALDFERNKNLTYPSKQDFLGAAESLHRLQLTYGLSNQDVANGVWSIGGSSKPYLEKFAPMSVSECLELGKALYTNKYYAPGIEWMKEAMRKHQERTIQEGIIITREEIQSQISNGYKELDKLLTKFFKWFDELAATRPSIENIDRTQIITYFYKGLTLEETLKAIDDEEHLRTFYKNVLAKMNLSPDELNKVNNALCRGERTNYERVSKRLSCYFAHGPHPFLILAPIKAERLHVVPEYLLFYEVISDAEILAIQTLTKPRLARLKVSFCNVVIEPNDRVCQGTFAAANESTSVVRIKTRIAQFTGLNITNSEALHIVNYGIGGYRAMHHDHDVNETNIRKEGNRLATIIFYMSNVEHGGATVFPALDLAVFPVKGAALYWKNLLHTGQGHLGTIHAACPVLQGSKWVAAQWIGTLRQENQRCVMTTNNNTIEQKLALPSVEEHE